MVTITTLYYTGIALAGVLSYAHGYSSGSAL